MDMGMVSRTVNLGHIKHKTSITISMAINAPQSYRRHECLFLGVFSYLTSGSLCQGHISQYL